MIIFFPLPIQVQWEPRDDNCASLLRFHCNFIDKSDVKMLGYFRGGFVHIDFGTPKLGEVI